MANLLAWHWRSRLEMSMRALRLNYVPHPTPRWPGFALLGVAAMVAVLVSYQYVNTMRSLEETDIVVSRLERRIMRGRELPTLSPAASAKDNGVVQRAGELTRKLTTPWEKLFKALETLRNENVALLSVEPDSAGGTVRVTAEAKDAAAMLEYVAELRESGLLSDVILNSHQVVLQSPFKPVRFTFAGQWMDQQ